MKYFKKITSKSIDDYLRKYLQQVLDYLVLITATN